MVQCAEKSKRVQPTLAISELTNILLLESWAPIQPKKNRYEWLRTLFPLIFGPLTHRVFFHPIYKMVGSHLVAKYLIPKTQVIDSSCWRGHVYNLWKGQVFHHPKKRSQSQNCQGEKVHRSWDQLNQFLIPPLTKLMPYINDLVCNP